MSTVKNFSFIIWRRRVGSPGSPYTWVGEYATPCRTLAEAQSELRHYIRVHHPELLDDLTGLAYTLEVSHV